MYSVAQSGAQDLFRRPLRLSPPLASFRPRIRQLQRHSTLSPTSRPVLGGPEPSTHSLTSSPISCANSASNSMANLRSHSMVPARSRTSLYSMKDSLTMTFGRRTRTRSAQAGYGDDPITDFGPSSGLSSAVTSPLASNVSLPMAKSWTATRAVLRMTSSTTSNSKSSALVDDLAPIRFLCHRLDSKGVHKHFARITQPQACTK